MKDVLGDLWVHVSRMKKREGSFYFHVQEIKVATIGRKIKPYHCPFLFSTRRLECLKWEFLPTLSVSYSENLFAFNTKN